MPTLSPSAHFLDARYLEATPSLRFPSTLSSSLDVVPRCFEDAPHPHQLSVRCAPHPSRCPPFSISSHTRILSFSFIQSPWKRAVILTREDTLGHPRPYAHSFVFFGRRSSRRCSVIVLGSCFLSFPKSPPSRSPIRQGQFHCRLSRFFFLYTTIQPLLYSRASSHPVSDFSQGKRLSLFSIFRVLSFARSVAFPSETFLLFSSSFQVSLSPRLSFLFASFSDCASSPPCLPPPFRYVFFSLVCS